MADKLLEEKLERHNLGKKAVDERIPDWNEKDEMYLGHVDKNKLISRARVTDAVPFRLITERASRIMANKPRGHFSPREGGDVTSAKILDTLIDYYWDNANHSGSMIYKWWLMVTGALKYGTSFGLIPYWYERRVVREKQGKELKYRKVTIYDGPEFKPLNIRDVYPDPSATNIDDANWVQVRSFMTMDQLEAINNSSNEDPTWINLDKLKAAAKEDDNGDQRDTEYTSRNKEIRGVQDYMGKDTKTPQFEFFTEYSHERWTTFSVKHNLLVRDMPNPLYSGDIPLSCLTHYPLEDDLYGLGELEPIKRLLRASTAMINQALDETNMKLYSPLKIDPSKVETSTIKWAPGAKWITTDMGAIQEHVVQSKFVEHFVPTYSFMLAAIQNAAGTTDVNATPAQQSNIGDTATGTRFIAQQQNSRDNLFRSFLEDQIRKQMEIWLQWIQQHTDKPKVLRVAGQDAMEFFNKRFPEAIPGQSGALEPNTVEMDGKEVNKFEDLGEVGFLAMTPEDIVGGFDYIPEVGSTQDYDPAIERNNLISLFNLITKPEAMAELAKEGQKIKMSEVEKELFHKFNVKNPERFFEDVQTAGPAMPDLSQGQGQPVPQPIRSGFAIPNTNGGGTLGTGG